MEQKKKKLSLNKETIRVLDDQQLKAVAGGTSLFGCGVTIPCTIWNTCGCSTELKGCYIAKNENPLTIDDVVRQTLEDLGRNG